MRRKYHDKRHTEVVIIDKNLKTRLEFSSIFIVGLKMKEKISERNVFDKHKAPKKFESQIIAGNYLALMRGQRDKIYFYFSQRFYCQSGFNLKKDGFFSLYF